MLIPASFPDKIVTIIGKLSRIITWETPFDQGLLRKKTKQKKQKKQNIEKDYRERGQLLSQIKNCFDHKHTLVWPSISSDGLEDMEVSFN